MYAHKLYSPWALWPLWAAHIIFLTVDLVLMSYVVLNLDGIDNQIPAGWATALALAFVNFVVEPVEYVMWSYHYLEPWIYLVAQILKAILWCVLVPFGIVFVVHTSVPVWLKIILCVLVVPTVLSFAASLVYAIYICLKSRKTGYQPAPDEKMDAAFRNSVIIRHGHNKPLMSRPIRAVSSPYEA